MSIIPIDPRPLNTSESDLLECMLSADFSAHDILLSQIPFARVVGRWGEGSPSIDLRVMEGPAPAVVPDGELPVSAQVFDDSGNFSGEITIWVEKGYLSAIEYGWITDDRPKGLPPANAVRIKY